MMSPRAKRWPAPRTQKNGEGEPMSLGKIVAALCATIVMSGCATIADPVTYSEQKSPGRSAAAKKVLVVLDVSLIASNLGESSAQKREQSLQEMFLPLANAMVDEVKKSGGDATHLIHSSGMRLPPPGPEYSHVWTQATDQLTKKGGLFISNYVWYGSIAERREGAGFAEIYRVKYQSDGSKCFIAALYFANKAECQKKYLEQVSGQWAKAGPKP
jgi:hypothetical protein